MNVFTKNVKPRKRGRPPGPTAQGAAARDRLYSTAIRLIAERGYEATTLRDIAKDAGVSVGLLYRYFPGKQAVIIALYEVLVGDPDEGVFAASTAFSRLRVQRVFEEAVAGSSDAPKQPLAEALGRLLYLVHLAVLLWWLLDKSSKQRATVALVSLTQHLLPSAALTLRVPPVRRFVIAVDELIREALFGSPVTG